MVIKDYSTNPLDGVRHIGRLQGRDWLGGGIVGYYEFPTLGVWAWVWVPEFSKGDYQGQRSPQNYTSLAEAQTAAWAFFAR